MSPHIQLPRRAIVLDAVAPLFGATLLIGSLRTPCFHPFDVEYRGTAIATGFVSRGSAGIAIDLFQRHGAARLLSCSGAATADAAWQLGRALEGLKAAAPP